eukprot:234275_1
MDAYDDALRIFEMIEGVNAQCLSSMLYVCSAVSPARWEDAILLLHTSDIVPGASNRGRIDYSALSYAVIACAKENEWEEGLNLLNIYWYGTTGKQSGNQVISVDAVNSIIAAAGRSKRPDQAIGILNEMESKYGVPPNERTYRSILISCNQAEHEKRRQRRLKQMRSQTSDYDHALAVGDDDEAEDDDSLALHWWEAALSLFRRMKEEGLTPDIQSYSSVISACEAAGQWQRAIGILGSMTKDGITKPNLFCYNAALAACEKGGAWLEAVEVYERMQTRDVVKPNFITMNSVLIALDNAGQKELAQSIYNEALKNRIILPWKWTKDADLKGNIRVLDLHQFSVPMSKIAVRHVIDSLLMGKPVYDVAKDLVIVVGKGKGSENGIRVLMPKVKSMLFEEYGLRSYIDENNSGRLYINSLDLQKMTNFEDEEEEDDE